MESSDDAALGAIAIGPTSTFGRAIALRLLFCKSVKELVALLLGRLRRFTSAAIRYGYPLLRLLLLPFNPRYPHILLAIVLGSAFALRRSRSVRIRAELAYRRNFWTNVMRSAYTYDEWSHGARMLEKERGRRKDCDLYDEDLVRTKLRELRSRRMEGNVQDILFCLRTDLVRNLGNMCNPELHMGRLQLAHLTQMEVRHRCNQIWELGFPMGGVFKLFAQEWEGDVTIVMPATLAQFAKLIQNPTPVELQKAVNQGRRCTWEKLSAINANCGIELMLDECVSELNCRRRLKRRTERGSTQVAGPTHRMSGAKRIPSWNCIARESSWGSLDEEGMVEAMAEAAGGPWAGTSSGALRFSRSSFDGSDSESENMDPSYLSWTQVGGPLMRTASAALFIQEHGGEVIYQTNKEDIRFHDSSDEAEVSLGPGASCQIPSKEARLSKRGNKIFERNMLGVAEASLREAIKSGTPPSDEKGVEVFDRQCRKIEHGGFGSFIKKSSDEDLTPDVTQEAPPSPGVDRVPEASDVECGGIEHGVFGSFVKRSSDRDASLDFS